jgi:hypothetical protein
LSKDVEITVVGSNLIKEAFWVVPLIEHRLDPIMRSVNPELNRPFIGLSARVTLHPQPHPYSLPSARHAASAMNPAFCPNARRE